MKGRLMVILRICLILLLTIVVLSSSITDFRLQVNAQSEPVRTATPVAIDDGHDDEDVQDHDHDDFLGSPLTSVGKDLLSDDDNEIPDNDQARVFLCLYADSQEDPPFDVSSVELLFNGSSDDPASDYQIGMKTALSLSTHGTAAITEVVYMDWVRMETNYLDYRYEYQHPDGTIEEFWSTTRLRTDCLKAHGYTETAPQEEYIISFYPKVGGAAAYGGPIPIWLDNGFKFTRRVVTSGTLRPETMLHELGHTHGFSHVRNFKAESYKSYISPVGKSDIVGFTMFELWEMMMFDEQYKARNTLELRLPDQDITEEVVVNLHQLHPDLGEPLSEGVHYAAYLSLDPERPLIENLIPRETHPPESLWIEYRCADQRYVEGMLNVDWFSRVQCGIRVYIVQNYRPDTVNFHILWSPMNWTYNTDMGTAPLDPQEPYQVYRVQNGAEDLMITVCAQYPDIDNPLVQPVHIGFNQMCTVPEPSVSPVPTWEVYLPLLQR
ncbi:MAG: hypothetical protein ACOCXQ_04480 [Patescibacteria group bacterium]